MWEYPVTNDVKIPQHNKHVIIFHYIFIDTMFEALSVYFQFVNERAAHVKIDRVLPLLLRISHSPTSLWNNIIHLHKKKNHLEKDT